MFRKTFKVKSNTKLRSSEKKKLIGKIQTEFFLKDEDILALFPSKESVSCVKIVPSNESPISLYVCEEVALFYEFDEQFHPTVFVLWRYPWVLPNIRIFSGVEKHLLNGADLMLPGIIPNQDHLGEQNFAPGKLVYINTDKNNAAVGVGTTLISSSLMISGSKRKGKAVHLFHYFGDELSKMFGGGCKEVPNLKISSHDEDVDLVTSLTEKITLPHEETNAENSELNITMDELLLYSFTKAMKKYHNELTFPILTNIFYKNCMMEVLPKNMNLDIKKTKYKKLSAFLSEMDDNKILCLENVKGVQSIVSVEIGHDIFKNFVDDYQIEDVQQEASNAAAKSLVITERNIINAHMEPIFLKYKYKKGDAVTDQEVRKILTDYVKKENLQVPDHEELVNLNGPLCDILQTKDLQTSWKNLFESVFKKMGKCYDIETADNQILVGKGKLLPIELTTAVKTSNKKVTVVKNLEVYGINLQEFSKECTRGVAASSTIISAAPNSKSAIFQIQGNQKKFIGNLLQEKYLIPKKYIEGLEVQKGKKK